MTKKTEIKLLNAAIKVLNEDPSSKMEKIAEAANVSRRTLHRYFNTRDDLLKSCSEWIMSEILRDVKAAIQEHGEPLAQLRQMLVDDIAKGQHFKFSQNFVAHFKDEAIQAEFKEMGNLFFGLLDQLKSDGLIEITLPNDWLSYVWMGIVQGASKALEDGAVAPKAINNLAWGAFTNGVLKASD